MNYLDHFVNYLKSEEKSDNTINSYLRDLKQFVSYLGKDMKELNQEDIDQYKNVLKEEGLKIKTINRKMVSVKQFIEFLNTECDQSIIVRIKQEKQQRQEYLEDMLDKHDFKKLVDAAVTNNDTRAKAIFYTLYYTGARVSEMLQIKAEDYKKEYIWVKGKGNKHRQLFISSKVRTAWLDYMKDRYDNSEFLFTGQRGRINRQTIHGVIKKYADLAGVDEGKAHAHNFRHFFCKSAIDKGLTIDTVADLAGHSDINTTRIYTRKTKPELMAAINEL
ncbi:tyrosine-type recombinase/integrase [Alkalibacillus silvisoli]|uniref:Tyrosine-type recombinase/integrase n=1 Tax=Alkalibacillus silvisoli TaxID=392823 RepID=A0ABN1AC05_9BACI